MQGWSMYIRRSCYLRSDYSRRAREAGRESEGMRVKRMGGREGDVVGVSDGRLKKGTWTPEEDALLLAFVDEHGPAGWNMARSYYPALRRTGKSCRLRYLNQLHPDIRRHSVSPQEERFILQAHAVFGNQWSKIASLLQGRTDNNVKNVVNMRLKRARRRAATFNFARAAARVLSPLNVVSASMSAPGLAKTYGAAPATDITIGSNPLQGAAAGRSEAITAEDMLMLAAISNLYPPDAAACSQSSAVLSNNWAALPAAGQLPSVQMYQGLSVGSELPSVQFYCNRSLGGSARAHKLPSVQLEQSTSFDSDMSEVAASFDSLKKSGAGDKDLLEAVYASSGSVTSDTSADSGNRDSAAVTNDMYSLNAILMDMARPGRLQLNGDMEYAYGAVQAEDVLMNHAPGIMEGFDSTMGADFASVLAVSTWDTMPAARHVDDLAFY